MTNEPRVYICSYYSDDYRYLWCCNYNTSFHQIESDLGQACPVLSGLDVSPLNRN